ARGRGSTIAFAISYRGRDPDTVAQITNTLASFYIEENLKARERQATGTAQFLSAQLEETRARLDEQERRVSEFKKRYAGELPQQLVAKKAAIAALKERIARDQPSGNKPDARPSVKGAPGRGGEVSVFKDDEARLRNALAIYEQRVANAPVREQQFQEISRDYESTKELYQSL